MRLRERCLITVAVGLVACAEPTGTESGNPSMPGAHAPLPNLPPIAPPLPPMPAQPSPTVAPVTDPAVDQTITETTEVAPDSSSAPTSPEGNPSVPMPPVMQPPTMGTTELPGVDGHGQTGPSPTTAGPAAGNDTEPSSEPVDAGDAGGVDAGE